MVGLRGPDGRLPAMVFAQIQNNAMAKVKLKKEK